MRVFAGAAVASCVVLRCSLLFFFYSQKRSVEHSKQIFHAPCIESFVRVLVLTLCVFYCHGFLVSLFHVGFAFTVYADEGRRRVRPQESREISTRGGE